jgi:precorrin-6A/cobalt-precorrin-6A reductase
VPLDQEQWHEVDDVAEAAAVAARLGRSLLVTTGRRDLAPFAALAEVRVLARCVDPPTESLPEHVQVLLDRGPYTVPGETSLMREHDVDVLVTKNSGGPLVAAKLTAARDLAVAVVMVRRPEPAGAQTVPDVDAAVAWVRDCLPDRGGQVLG